MRVKTSLFQISVFLLTVGAVYLFFVKRGSGNKNLSTSVNNSKFLVNSRIPKTTEKSLLGKTKERQNVWFIFRKVTEKSPLKYRFHDLLMNILNVSSILLKFHVIVDESSREIASEQFTDVVYKTNKSVLFKFYDFNECASRIGDIVNVMTPYFSSKPGTYYSDALFYISIGLYRIAPHTQEKAILLDCDLYFKKDIALLFDEFSRFKPSALFGLAPELTPVYRHILHTYKLKHKTTFGEFHHQNDIMPNFVHPKGFQGYNSGVVLINFKAQRRSKEFYKIITKYNIRNLTTKYNFRGHLGDQDFYTLLGFEYPHLIQTLNCGFNRQLCTWWREHGYEDIFDKYFQCNHPVVVMHGNCNTKIPKDLCLGVLSAQTRIQVKKIKPVKCLRNKHNGLLIG